MGVRFGAFGDLLAFYLAVCLGFVVVVYSVVGNYVTTRSPLQTMNPPPLEDEKVPLARQELVRSRVEERAKSGNSVREVTLKATHEICQAVPIRYEGIDSDHPRLEVRERIADIIRQHITPLLAELQTLNGEWAKEKTRAAFLHADLIAKHSQLDSSEAARLRAEEQRDMSYSATTQAILQHNAMRKQAEMSRDECASEMVARIEAEAKLAKAEAQGAELKRALEQCPWPESVWVMTTEEYVKAVPDEVLRTAISGLLARVGWECAQKQLARVAAREVMS